ncbi:ABC transporter ATP-binding protein [Desulforhopalus singaporensis]|uniref:Amino acid/amide ABC transporter ATP-binding protein 2, HAAT family (TC 3.A.1.4.-) n=1 Tax=Desulforhopalus singaporensis TaxID=91360 RepID=A0A1H0U2G7_9BACT|nr:ABC transporter ATP-binding protein [Desulforhopalus singaporensis]SDP60492.1 amino acid/amide ABC transporter ATP-binding protein 2, HAAT family (TC 3.A.1.4.-) [Desulforhopalus singaporensis]
MLLEVKKLNAGYGYLQILRDVSLNVDTGEYVCLVGPNGAGKSTTLKTIAGLLSPTSGEILFDGEPIGGLPGNKVTRKGISLVSEDMNLFVNMSVEENLAMGAYIIRDKKAKKKQLEFVYDLFPRLAERSGQLAGTMSGGERKMLAIGRGLMANPQLLLVDEPSFGLAPQLTENVFQSLDVLVKKGLTIMLVEQNVTKTLEVTDRGYVLENGSIELSGKSSDLADNPHVRKVFLGV